MFLPSSMITNCQNVQITMLPFQLLFSGLKFDGQCGLELACIWCMTQAGSPPLLSLPAVSYAIGATLGSIRKVYRSLLPSTLSNHTRCFGERSLNCSFKFPLQSLPYSHRLFYITLSLGASEFVSSNEAPDPAFSFGDRLPRQANRPIGNCGYITTWGIYTDPKELRKKAPLSSTFQSH